MYTQHAVGSSGYIGTNNGISEFRKKLKEVIVIFDDYYNLLGDDAVWLS
jgi:hypothetical protein